MSACGQVNTAYDDIALSILAVAPVAAVIRAVGSPFNAPGVNNREPESNYRAGAAKCDA